MAEKRSRFRETQDELQAMPQITLNDYRKLITVDQTCLLLMF